MQPPVWSSEPRPLSDEELAREQRAIELLPAWALADPRPNDVPFLAGLLDEALDHEAEALKLFEHYERRGRGAAGGPGQILDS